MARRIRGLTYLSVANAVNANSKEIRISSHQYGSYWSEADIDDAVRSAIDACRFKRAQTRKHGLVDIVVNGLRTLHDREIESLSDVLSALLESKFGNAESEKDHQQ